MKRLLFVATLALAPAAASSETTVKGCCQRPLENPPRAPQKRALCSGTLWSLAQPGRCVAGTGQAAACHDASFSTLVMVREYTLSWNEKMKECVLVTSGRSWPTTVATCDGNSC